MPHTPSTSQSLDMQHLIELETDPAALEQHYRKAPGAFKEALEAAFAQRPDSPVFQVWHARLSSDPAATGAVPAEHAELPETRRLLWVAGLVLLAGTLA